MENLLKSLIVFCIILLLSSNLWSSHIVGGEISYKFKNYNSDRTKVTFDITMSLYRDTKGLQFDQYANFGVYIQEPWGAWRSYETIEFIELGRVTEISPGTDPCRIRNLTDERLELGLYTFEVTLDVTDNNYLISYQKCCRNFSISNITGSGDIGSVYDVLITPQAIQSANSSPVFGNLPPIFICSDEPLTIENAATDMEGDQLIYTLCTPNFSGTDESFEGACGTQNPNPAICPPPYPEVVYTAPFTSDFPLFSDPPLLLHSETGLLTGTPTQAGSYVVAICISEYRNGILLSESRRDFEFNVVQCMDNLEARIQASDFAPSLTTDETDSIAVFESCHDLDFTFINESEDLRFIRTYSWKFWNEEEMLIFDEMNSIIRDLEMSFPSFGRYTGEMILNEGEECADTAYMHIDIIPPLDPLIFVGFDSCVAGPVIFQLLTTFDNRDFDVEWDLGDGSTSDTETVLHSYSERGTYEVSISLTDEFGCMEETSNDVDWVPFHLTPPDTIQSGRELCQGDSIYIDGIWITQPGLHLNITPAHGNGCDSIIEIIEIITLPESRRDFRDTICIGETYAFGELNLSIPGLYFDTITNRNGCDSIIVLDLVVGQNLSRINVDEKLELALGTTITLEPEVRGGDLINTQWFEVDEFLSSGLTLDYLVQDDEWVFFQSTNDLFCIALDSIFINPYLDVNIYFPNVITPNGDGINDIFNIGASDVISESQLSIFDRWGNEMYVGDWTTDRQIESGWDGTYNNTPAGIGTYAYMVRVIFINGESVIFSGDITVIR